MLTDECWLGHYDDFYFKDINKVFEFLKQENHIVLMQFTGLYDKNGKEIYEGDIFQDDEDYSYDFVEWSDYYNGFATDQWFSSEDLAYQAKGMEVVGNIYENKELLQ